MIKSIYILGISAFYHDSAAALIKDGEIIAAAQEERFTRKKHDPSFPDNAIAYCLKEANITVKDLSFVGFYDKPFLKFERILFTYLTYAPFGVRSFLKAMPSWLNNKLFLKDVIKESLHYDGEIIFAQHHQSHAASAFFPSPFQKAAVLTVDGVGEWASSSFGIGEDNKIKLLGEIKFPHSLGLLYSAFTYYSGFKVNSGEYKLMGLAPYGEPRYVDIIRKELIDIKDDGSFKLNMKYFNFCAGLTMTNNRFAKLFELPVRKPESAITQAYMDIARSAQVITEEIMLKMVNHVHKVTKCDKLCLAGGVALNCVGNGRILRESLFKDIWIQPASGDAGGALGVALFVWNQYMNRQRVSDEKNDQQKGTLLGPCYSQADIEQFIEKNEVSCSKMEETEISKIVARLINDQKVIGLFQGRMEFGPRTLGARSIIADSRSEKMQSLINLKIKFRESFRPFAPSVLENKLKDFFVIDRSSPYMMLTVQIQDDKIFKKSLNVSADGLEKLKIKRSIIPAVTHVDYSARIQSVSKEFNSLYYEIIKEFYNVSGCPVIINTSFNIRGEPIVCSLEDAYRCFMCTDMDYLIMGSFLFDKEKQPDKDQYKKENISTILD